MSLLTPGSGVFAGLLEGQPTLPSFQPIDPLAEQQKAIGGNIAALPKSEQLASGVNQFNQQQLESMLQFAIPGYEKIKSGVSSTIQDELSGKIPGDVGAAIQESDAASALQGGFGGTPMHGNLVARDFGMTSLNLINQGLGSANNWLKTMASIEQPGFFNVSSMFLSPGQVMAQDTEERNSKFQHDWSQNILDWQGSLGYLVGQDMASDTSQFNSMVSSVGGSAAGGAAGAAASGGGL